MQNQKKDILHNWNIHQVGCDWNRNRIYGNKVCDMNCKNCFEVVVSSIKEDEEDKILQVIKDFASLEHQVDNIENYELCYSIINHIKQKNA